MQVLRERVRIGKMGVSKDSSCPCTPATRSEGFRGLLTHKEANTIRFYF